MQESAALNNSAQDHANDMAATKQRGHKGSGKPKITEDGSTYQTRIEKYAKWGGAIFESMCYGNVEEEKYILDLIVDDGIEWRSHRKAIFGEHFVHIGVGVADHPVEGRVVVIDYGA